MKLNELYEHETVFLSVCLRGNENSVTFDIGEMKMLEPPTEFRNVKNLSKITFPLTISPNNFPLLYMSDFPF